MTSCNKNNSGRENSHLYWKTISVEVIECHFKYWYASGFHHQGYIKVKSEEYDLEKSFNLNGQNAIKIKNLKKGDIINAELYSWKIDSTNEIIKREIHTLK